MTSTQKEKTKNEPRKAPNLDFQEINSSFNVVWQNFQGSSCLNGEKEITKRNITLEGMIPTQ
jgi:hypothetical protein